MVSMRATLKAQRLALSPTDVLTLSNQIIDRVCASHLIHGKHIALYLSHQHEVMAEHLLPWLFKHGMHCYLPVLAPNGKQLCFAEYHADTGLQPNRYGILEPIAPHHLCAPAQLDTVFVPLVAFTTQGERLGMGAGYYDTTFAFLNHTPRPQHPRLIGLAYDFQQMPALVQHENDVTLDAVVTESHCYERIARAT